MLQLKQFTAMLLFLTISTYSAADLTDSVPLSLQNASDASHKPASYYQDLIKNLESAQGTESAQLIEVLDRLAALQMDQDTYHLAERNIIRSIKLREKHHGPYHPGLMSPLNQLGKLYMSTKDFESAHKIYQRSQHISHRNDGVYTLRQLEMIDGVTLAYLAMGNIKSANVQQQFFYTVNQRNYEKSDIRMLPAMWRWGRWLKQSGQYAQAESTVKEALQLVEGHPDAQIDHHIAFFRELASIQYLADKCCPQDSLSYVNDLINQAAASDHTEKVAALLDLADMMLLKKSRSSEVKSLYKQAWSMLAVNADLSQPMFRQPEKLGIANKDDMVTTYVKTKYNLRHFENNNNIRLDDIRGPVVSFGRSAPKEPNHLIGAPLQLCYPQILDFAKVHRKKDLLDLYVDVNFSVDDRGKVSKVQVIESNAPMKLRVYVINVLRKVKYRPRIDQGEVVETHNVAFRQTFQAADRQNLIVPSSVRSASEVAALHGCQMLTASNA